MRPEQGFNVKKMFHVLENKYSFSHFLFPLTKSKPSPL